MVSTLANRLQRHLMAKQTRSWEFDLEEGLLDAGRLSRVVVDPVHPLSFKRETDMDFRGHRGQPADRQFGLPCAAGRFGRRHQRPTSWPAPWSAAP